MRVSEKELTKELSLELIRLSKMWEKENNVFGYVANDESEFKDKRIFVAVENNTIIGYLFGSGFKSKNMKSIMKEDTDCFEMDELYVIPEYRSKGIGKKLFQYAESMVKEKYDYITLSTANKNAKAILHFYIEEVGMEFWSARLFKKIK